MPSGYRLGPRGKGHGHHTKGEEPEATAEVGFVQSEVTFPNPTEKAAAFQTGTAQIPYRGAEQHGIPYVGTPEHYGIDPGREIMADVIVEPIELPTPEPVPVRIVSDPTFPVVERKKVAMTNYSWPVTSVGPAYTLAVCGFREERTKLHLIALSPAGQTGDRIYLNDAQDMNVNDCLIMRPGDTIDLETTEPIYAMLDPAAANGGAILCVVQEYSQVIEMAK